ncbi:glycosyltransferase family 39 protein [Nonomuraea sp. NPDC059194]|uniref:glycosyltransferase family 39 protein n=1 Tax=Nonomuraea sp. NPDC059194 TaxID=3346764 RepID=UPI0036738A19
MRHPSFACAIIAFCLGLWGLTGPSMWCDEIVTADLATRSMDEIMAVLAKVDAVHGLYYLIAKGLAELTGQAGEVVLRLPSMLAITAASAVLAGIGRRIAGPGVGLVAGVLFAALPMVSLYAHEARSYALVALLATVATWLLIRGIQDGGRRWFAGYAVALALMGLTNLIALLLVMAHGATLLWARPPRRAVLWWLAATTAGVLATLPLVLTAYQQKGAVAWIPVPTGAVLWDTVRDIAGSVLGTVVLVALIGMGAWSGRRRHLGIAAVVLPWALLPPLALVALSPVQSLFMPRYLFFCVPAWALAAAAGAVALRPAPRLAVLAALTALLVPANVAARAPGAKPMNVRAVAGVLNTHAQAGDLIVYVPRWPRLMWAAYPGPGSRLRDVTLESTARQTGTLVGADALKKDISARLASGGRRVWLVRLGQHSGGVEDLQRTRRRQIRAAGGYTMAGRWGFAGARVILFERPVPGPVR